MATTVRRMRFIPWICIVFALFALGQWASGGLAAPALEGETGAVMLDMA